MQPTDRGAGAAAVVGRGDDEHVVPVVDERGGERVDAGRVDAVVVGHQDAHGVHGSGGRASAGRPGTDRPVNDR